MNQHKGDEGDHRFKFKWQKGNMKGRKGTGEPLERDGEGELERGKGRCDDGATVTQLNSI